MNRPAAIWVAAAVAYLAFFTWYTGTGEPLTPEEVDLYIGRLAASGRDPARLERFRELLEADTGGDLVIVNAVLLHERPLQLGDVGPGESSEEVLGRYMAFMWPELLRRASHPVIVGTASIPVEVWGVEGVDRWSFAGLMRYRSLRDLMEIATHPGFDEAHQYKLAAMSRTLAFPIDAGFYPGEPRLLAALVAISAALLLHLLWGRRIR